jgi:hypothetical protein
MGMEKESAAALAAKSVATGAAAAFGLTWWALAAAILGAVASLHREPPAAGSKVWTIAFQVGSLATLAALLGAALPFLPFCDALSEVPVALRCGLLGVFANPVAKGITTVIPAVAGWFSRKAGG